MSGPRKPDYIDVQYALEVATRRRGARIKQAALAEHLNISPQQLSKYERGKNRMSISAYKHAIAFIEMASPPVMGFSEAAQEPFGRDEHSSPDLRTLLLRARDAIDLCLAKLDAG